MIWTLVHLYIVPVYMFLAFISGAGFILGSRNTFQKVVSFINMLVCMYYFLYICGDGNALLTLFCLTWTVICTSHFVWQSTIGLDRAIARELRRNPDMNPHFIATITRVMMLVCVPAIVYVICEYVSSLG